MNQTIASLHPAALHAAFWRVRANRGAPGADGQSIDQFGAQLAAETALLAGELASGSYVPGPLATCTLTKSGKKTRLIKIPTVRDRVVQTAVAARMGPMAEARFSSASHGYRPGRSVITALDQVDLLLNEGREWVLDADIAGFFDAIPHRKMLATIDEWVADESMLPLVYQAIAHGAAAPGRGIAQGSPLSPLLSNIFLHQLDDAFRTHDIAHVRYADDFVVLARSESEAYQAHALAGATLAAMGLELHPDKTRVARVRDGLRFLGADIKPDAERAGQARVYFPGWATPAEIAGADEASVCESTAPASGEVEDARPVEGSGALRTLYLVQPGVALTRDGGRFVVRKGDHEVASQPAHAVDLVIAFGSAVVTSRAMQLALEHRIPVVLLEANGAFCGMVDSHDHGSVPMQAAQFRVLGDRDTTLAVARAIVVAKIGNGATMIKRHGERHANTTVAGHLNTMRQLREQARHVATLEALRGCEGLAARSLFAAMRELLGPLWQFNERNRRPPKDPINAMLSFGYSLVCNNVFALIKGCGLNPQVGTLHDLRPGHAALASDMMEPFRAPVVESLVLHLASSGRMLLSDFSSGPEGESLMTPEARKRFITAFEEKMGGNASHPGGYRDAMRTQIQSYAAHLRHGQPLRIHTIR